MNSQRMRRAKEEKMEYKDGGLCVMQDRRFASGQEICDDKSCYRCNNGNWEPRFIDLVYGVGP